MARRMKDSGVAWIGQVPEGWDVERIASLYGLRNTKCSDKEYPALSVTMKGIVPQLEDVAKTDDGDNRKLVKCGDFVINSRSDRRGACGISQYDGSVSLINIVLRPLSGMNNGYYSWLFRSFAFADEFYANGHGIVDDLWTTRWQDMKRIKSPFPPLAEQERIAQFLDKKCGKIDELSEKVKAQIEKLEAYKKSIITEAVTPKEGWEVKRLKYLFAFGKGLDITKADLVDKGIPVVSYGQIHAKYNVGVRLDDSLLRFVPEDYLADNDSRILRKNEFAFADTSEDLEGLGNFVLNDTDKTVFAGYHTIIFRPKTELPYKYLAYLFLSDAWRSQLRTRCSGIKVYSLTQKVLNATSVVIPPDKECEKIVKHLDKKCGKVDEIIRQRKAQLEKLAEYKKSLIYEYVTGKKEVAA